MKKIFFILLFVATLYGKDNAMTIYGNVNADMDIFFRAMYYAQNAKDTVIKDGLKRELLEEEGCYMTTSGSYTAPTTNKRPKVRFVNTKVKIEDGSYKVIIPLIASKIDNCTYTLHEVKLLLGKKHYGIDDKNINSFDIYKYYGDTNYALYFFEKPPERKYTVLADENICKAIFYNKDETRIEAKLRATKGKSRVINPMKENISIKIDIVLDNKEDYNPNEFYDNQTFFEKLKNRIFG